MTYPPLAENLIGLYLAGNASGEEQRIRRSNRRVDHKEDHAVVSARYTDVLRLQLALKQ